MKRFQKLTSCILTVSLLSGCAVSSSRMIEDGYSISDTSFCRNYLNDFKDLRSKQQDKTITAQELEYLQALRTQRTHRSITRTKCEELVKDQNTTVIAVSILAIIAAAAAANSGGGGGSYSNSGYAWDQFYDGYGNLVWRCRSKSTGQFAYNSSCAGAYKVDSTWPAK